MTDTTDTCGTCGGTTRLCDREDCPGRDADYIMDVDNVDCRRGCGETLPCPGCSHCPPLPGHPDHPDYEKDRAHMADVVGEAVSKSCGVCPTCGGARTPEGRRHRHRFKDGDPGDWHHTHVKLINLTAELCPDPCHGSPTQIESCRDFEPSKHRDNKCAFHGVNDDLCHFGHRQTPCEPRTTPPDTTRERYRRDYKQRASEAMEFASTRNISPDEALHVLGVYATLTRLQDVVDAAKHAEKGLTAWGYGKNATTVELRAAISRLEKGDTK